MPATSAPPRSSSNCGGDLEYVPPGLDGLLPKRRIGPRSAREGSRLAFAKEGTLVGQRGSRDQRPTAADSVTARTAPALPPANGARARDTSTRRRAKPPDRARCVRRGSASRELLWRAARGRARGTASTRWRAARRPPRRLPPARFG